MNLIFKFVLVVKTISNFPLAIADKFGLLKGEVTYRTRNNLKFKARAGTEDMAEITVVISGTEYPMNLIKIPENPIIFDLGGHIGTFSILMAHTLRNKCKIMTFEPNVGNYKLLLENIKLNKCKSISPINVAISNYSGKGFLEVNNLNTDAYHLVDDGMGKSNCSVSTIINEAKKVNIDHIDLLKMDIEGGEYVIFQDKESFSYICKNIHYLFVEYHTLDKHRNEKIFKNIIKDHFKILSHHKSVYVLENIKWRNKKF